MENFPEKTSFFNQANFPKLWQLFQYIFGAIADKRKNILTHYSGQKRVLEIGCSVGIISKAFTKFPDIEFTGIDIDEGALKYARELFKDKKNFKFINVSLSDLAKSGEKFGYVLFASILHHTNDTTAVSLLKDVKELLSKDATLLVIEPEKKRDNYNLLFKFWYRLERGQYRRDANELTALIKESGMEIKSVNYNLMSPNLFRFLKVSRSILMEISIPN